MKRYLIPTLLLIAAQSQAGLTGFENRNAPAPYDPGSESNPPAPPTVPANPQPVAKLPEPPAISQVQWMKVPYEKAENEVLVLLQRDLPKIQDLSKELVLYEVRATGELPPDYSNRFRTKLERILLSQPGLHLKDCAHCDQSRLVKQADGQLRFEPSNTDPARRKKIAGDLDVEEVLEAELNYSREDLRLRVRMINANTQEVRWTGEYSAADVVHARRTANDGTLDRLGSGDALSRLMIGEIAFTTVLSMGTVMMPTANQGYGSSSLLYPTIDIFIGEKYNGGRRRFGFVLGASLNAGVEGDAGKPLPFLVRIGAQFRHTFNPLNMSTARWSIAGEAGPVISTGIVTGYVGVGVEMAMMERFSVSLMPMYFLTSKVKGTEILVEGENGTINSAGNKDGGTFGGLGLALKANINW